jgi:hypothetical protein
MKLLRKGSENQKPMGSNLGASPPLVGVNVLYKTDFLILLNQRVVNQKPDRESSSSIMRNLAAVQHAMFLHAARLFS